MTIVDSAARSTALDPLKSFCVTAPAGSGKTELLIQRYLALLARVEKPEQVLAITFTRKAAAEMRERVLQALRDAVNEVPWDSPHQEKTHTLALQAIATDKRYQWDVIRNSSQINIKTIDSFCASLTRQMPVLSRFGGQASVSDKAEDLYVEAVEGLFELLETDSPIRHDLQAIMSHLDNDWQSLQTLLVAMLGRREQWSTYLGVHHQPDEAEQYLLATVESLVDDALAGLVQKLGPYSSELVSLHNYAARNLGEPELADVPVPSNNDLALWRRFKQLLLTAGSKGKWRSRVDVRMGFPAGNGEAKAYKERIKVLINDLREIDGLLPELRALGALPEIQVNNRSWQLVLHLSRILPMLSAQLLLVFQRQGRVDHTQIALSALDALGEDDRPTELALRMDYQLQHLLLDEFQDTAINQYELVCRLSRGWGEYNNANPDNPRTIMIVGDGMQSIYGFRNANVGLFLKARAEGFNGVELEYLSLVSNFRSRGGIVDWVNQTFSIAFPFRDNIAHSQISYTAATAVKPSSKEAAVALHGFHGENGAQQEVEFICREIQRGVDDCECQSIAILARGRGHLQGILARLKDMGIKYSAQDIDSLASSEVVNDLMSLCRALENPADAVAWSAVLRAPWCGLTLADLFEFRRASRHLCPWEALATPDVLATLSADGQNRLARLISAFMQARQYRDRLALRIWVEQLWLSLDGPAAVQSSSNLDDAERFFQLLEQAEREGEGLNINWLQSQLQRLYVKSQNPDSKIEVMTLHKAKGLEFDWVIIPSLEKTMRSNTRPLLNWDDYTGASGQRGFLLAANDHSDSTDTNLYNYLEFQRVQKELEETTRLLYVGATRAVSHLLLTASLKYDEEKEQYKTPPERSLLGRIWPAFEAEMQSHESAVVGVTPSPVTSRGLLRVQSVKAGAHFASPSPDSADKRDATIPRRSHNRVDRAVGTLVHLVLEQLSGLSSLPRNMASAEQACCSRHLWQSELRQLGIHGADLDAALVSAGRSIDTVLQDEEGRWLLASSHPGSASELALSHLDNTGKLRRLVIDRTFIDEKTGVRWLIDYKNSQPADGEPREDFFKREEETYSSQLALYRGALQAMGNEPVQCALYFTALGKLHRVAIPLENRL